MDVSARPMTAEELIRLPDEGKRYELIEGELRVMAPGGARHGTIAGTLCGLVSAHVRAHNLGVVCAAETGYRLKRDPDTVRAPDLSFVSHDRIPPQGIPDSYWDLVPDLAVEVVSPSDTADEVLEKVGVWLAAGTRMVWVVHPKTRTVTSYRSLKEIRVLTAEESLEGEDVVPGLSLRIGDLF
ncbi:MAG: Uma2 family endonuclease [Candidatus Tectomicrobia bacterium]|uniref:Uma2 family endonuclease n=1 Tax=Tectimicrobiota bacterium TaxID=2528274 RepID=A0A932CQY9_UNCTE|nr:Uma2 family endonuclease [Candidatus Tectomicrobia bacterium]